MNSNRPLIIACGIFLLSFSVYLFTMVPSITEDDSGEQTAVCTTLGTSHSPGYPFYCMAGKSAVTLVPWGNHAYRVNLVSAFFIAMANAVLFLTMVSMGSPLYVAVSLSLIFGFTKCVWAMANVTEVYGTAAFMACLLGWFLLRKPSLAALLFVAFAFGVGMTTHYTIGLLIVGIAWWAIAGARSLGGIGVKGWIVVFIFVAMGFSMTLYLYIRAKTIPLISWEDPQTLGRFWQVIARLRYGAASLAQGGAPLLSPDMIVKKLWFFLTVMKENFTLPVVLLFLLGLWRAFKDRFTGWTLILLVLGSGPGFLILANVGISKSSAELLERFFFLAFIFATLIMAEGAKKLPFYVAGIIAFMPFYLLFANEPSLNHRNEFLFYDYGKNILRSLPKNSILFSDRADEMEFALAYLHLSEQERPDVEYIDCNAGISRSIYGDDYYRVWGKPRLERREKIENEIVEKTGRPVYYATFFPDMIHVKRVQEGLVFRAKPLVGNATFPYSQIYALRGDGIDPEDDRDMSLLLSHYRLLGQYYLSINDIQNSDRQFGWISAYDDQGNWTSDVGFLYHQKGNLEMAEKYYLRAIERGSKSADVYNNLGALYETKSRYSEAENMYRTALRIDPANAQCHYNLAVMYWKRAQWKDVVSELEKVLEINPDHREANIFLPQARARAGIK